jgi:hypothetical protein
MINVASNNMIIDVAEALHVAEVVREGLLDPTYELD